VIPLVAEAIMELVVIEAEAIDAGDMGLASRAARLSDRLLDLYEEMDEITLDA